jgi:predicted RNA-binding Zn-ribbon protein involved in translation (DUF1610 family)
VNLKNSLKGFLVLAMVIVILLTIIPVGVYANEPENTDDRYKDYWLAGPGGSLSQFMCPECGIQHVILDESFSLYYYPPGTVIPQLALIVVTCENCGTISEWIPRSNSGSSLSVPLGTPMGANNIAMGSAELVTLFVSIVFLPGSNGELEFSAPIVVEKEGVWKSSWEPIVYPDT